MKRIVIIFLVICLSAGALAAQDNKVASIGLVFTDSIAFAGIGAEVFLGNLGIGGTFTFLPLGSGDAMVIFYEPGAYGRFYLGDPASCMYLTGGLTYLTAAGGSGDSSGIQSFDGGILNINGGMGYNAMFGSNNATRFYVEVGPRYTSWLYEGQDAGVYTGFFLHFAMGFGATF